jgi:putative acetyltransferase
LTTETPDGLEIRGSELSDRETIESLYPAAFPDEDLLPIVRDLLAETDGVVSLVATSDSQVAGHVIFTRCGVDGTALKAALLAPLAVAPAWQRRGIGSALVRAGVEKLEDAGTDIVLVLGDPAYYARFGFATETLVEPPYRLPAEWAEAWQSLVLSEAAARRAGVLTVPAPWRKPALWAP